MRLTFVQRRWLKQHRGFVWACCKDVTPCIDANGDYDYSNEVHELDYYSPFNYCPICFGTPDLLVFGPGGYPALGYPDGQQQLCLHCWAWTDPKWLSTHVAPAIPLPNA